jgi:hypothetical protein
VRYCYLRSRAGKLNAASPHCCLLAQTILSGSYIVASQRSLDAAGSTPEERLASELRQRPALAEVPAIVVTVKELTAEDVRILSGQTDGIIAKDQAYLTELAAAVRGRLAPQPSAKTEPVAA